MLKLLTSVLLALGCATSLSADETSTLTSTVNGDHCSFTKTIELDDSDKNQPHVSRIVRKIESDEGIVLYRSEMEYRLLSERPLLKTIQKDELDSGEVLHLCHDDRYVYVLRLRFQQFVNVERIQRNGKPRATELFQLGMLTEDGIVEKDRRPKGQPYPLPLVKSANIHVDNDVATIVLVDHQRREHRTTMKLPSQVR